MTASLAKTLACLQALGIKVDLEDFDFRLRAQKTTYLLQQLGVPIPYFFTLYVRGPYAPALTKELFENEAGKRIQPSAESLTKKDLAAIAKLKKHLELRPAQLEIAATYHYLAYQMNLAEDVAIRRLKELKPFLPEREVVVGISRVKQLFPQATEKDIRDLRREMKPWEEATRKSDRS